MSRRRHARTAVYGLLAALVIVVAGAFGGMAGDVATGPRRPMVTLERPRVVVLKARRTLHLFDGDTLVRTYPIDLGWAPVGQKQGQGDGRTPMGTFKVVTKNANSPYHRFLGIDYPNEQAVRRGLDQGLISAGEAASICQALEAERCPDWGTALGGGIGIHGHRLGWDWSAGCVALSDEHVEELYSVLRLGDPVEILP